MARLSDEKKWSDPWFRSLLPEFKLAWLYLIDNVDVAGVIELDRDLAEFQIRASIDWDRFLRECGDRIVKRPNGQLWIPKAAKFQLGSPGVLNPKNNFHMGVMKCLQKHNLWGVFQEKFPSCCVKIGGGPPMAHARPTVGPPMAHEEEGEEEESITYALEKTSDLREEIEQKSSSASDSNKNGSIVPPTRRPANPPRQPLPDPYAPAASWSPDEKRWWHAWLTTWRNKHRGQDPNPMVVSKWRTQLLGQPGHVVGILEFSCEKNTSSPEVEWYLQTLARKSGGGVATPRQSVADALQASFAAAAAKKGGAA